jgi:hypothetical protein
VRFARDWKRVRCLDPAADLEMLAAMENDIRARLESAKDRERLLRMMRESFSGSIQASAPNACLTDSPEREVEELARLYLDPAPRSKEREAGGRALLVGRMRTAFENAGVWPLMRKRISVAAYTYRGDPLKLDCGYRPNGVIRLFHAVSLETDVDAAKVLAFSFPQIAEGMARVDRTKAELTAVVEDELDRNDDEIGFALETLRRSDIHVIAGTELPAVADQARRELRL